MILVKLQKNLLFRGSGLFPTVDEAGVIAFSSSLQLAVVCHLCNASLHGISEVSSHHCRTFLMLIELLRNRGQNWRSKTKLSWRDLWRQAPSNHHRHFPRKPKLLWLHGSNATALNAAQAAPKSPLSGFNVTLIRKMSGMFVFWIASRHDPTCNTKSTILLYTNICATHRRAERWGQLVVTEIRVLLSGDVRYFNLLLVLLRYSECRVRVMLKQVNVWLEWCFVIVVVEWASCYCTVNVELDLCKVVVD